MAKYRITLMVDGNNVKTIEAQAAKAFGKDAGAQVAKVNPATSRDARLGEIADAVSEAASDVECLKDELQEWRDNLPENLQDGTKAGELEEAIDALDTLHDELEAIDFGSVTFPGMY